jgi:putative restriction endonuclease
MARSDLWTREQLIMALNVYFKIPFKDVKEKHPLIQKYAPLIGRTPTALKMKIGNFGRLDPTLKPRLNCFQPIPPVIQSAEGRDPTTAS